MKTELLPLKEALNKYTESEFEHEQEDFNKNCIVPLAYSTKGDNEEFQIQVNFNVVKNRIEHELSGLNIFYVEYLQYRDIEHASFDIANATFEDMIEPFIVDIDKLAEEDKKGISRVIIQYDILEKN